MGYTFRNNDLLLGRYSGSFFKEQVITPNSGSIILFDKNLNPTVVTTSSLYFNKLSASKLNVNGNTTLGDSSSDTLTVSAKSTFTAPITASSIRVTGVANFVGNTTLGDASSDILTVGAKSTFTAPITASSVTVSGVANFLGNTTLGDSSSDTLTVGAKSTFTGPLTASSIRVTGVASFLGNTTLGDSSSDTLTVGAKSTFTGPLTSSNFRVNGRLHISSSVSGAAFIVSTINQGSTNETNATLIVTGSKVGINTDDVDYNLEVNGSFAATTKSFVIDYKDKPGLKLVHASLEGPEHGVYVRGNATSNKVFLPDYWNWLVNENNMSVQLTPNKKYQELFVENIILSESSSYFTVKECGIKGWFNRIFKKPINFSYVIHAERKDVPILKTEIKKKKK